MKKISFLLTLCLIFTIQAFATGNPYSAFSSNSFSIGLWGGIANASLEAEGGFPVFGPYDARKFGAMLGATIEKQVWNHISLETGFLYSQLGGKTETLKGSDEYGHVLGDYNYIQDLRYIEIPLSLKLNFKTHQLNSFLIAGPNLGILLTANEKFKADYTTDIKYNENIEHMLSTYNIGFEFGLGTRYPVNNRLSLAVISKYAFGLTDQVKDSAITTVQKSRDLKVIAGLYIGL